MSFDGMQAAEGAGKRYVWRVDVGEDSEGSVLLARLEGVVDGCLVADPSSRWTLPRVLDALTTLQRDVEAIARRSHLKVGSEATSPAARPAPATTAAVAPVYDVMAIVDAMEALGIATGAVIDAIGGVTAASLDALRPAGVPYVKCMAVKRALAASGTTTAITTAIVPAQVCVALLWTGREVLWTDDLFPGSS